MKSKRTIYLKYVDFWEGFNCLSEYFWLLLSEEYNLIISDEPDFIIYSNYGVEHLNYHCPRLFISYENERPNFNICDFAISSDYINNSKHYQLPVFASVFDAEQYVNTNKEDLFDSWLNKTEFCSFVVSNSKCKVRNYFFNYINNNYKKVNSGGSLYNNINYKVNHKISFVEKHKFNIAFENSIHPGYLTEKITDSFIANTIPIYWGDPLVTNYFNKKRFLNYSNFSNVDQIIFHLDLILKNKDISYSYISQPIFVNDQVPIQLQKKNILKFLKIFFSLNPRKTLINSIQRKCLYLLMYKTGKLSKRYYGISEEFR